jgi:hypothetical protein
MLASGSGSGAAGRAARTLVTSPSRTWNFPKNSTPQNKQLEHKKCKKNNLQESIGSDTIRPSLDKKLPVETTNE